MVREGLCDVELLMQCNYDYYILLYMCIQSNFQNSHAMLCTRPCNCPPTISDILHRKSADNSSNAGQDSVLRNSGRGVWRLGALGSRGAGGVGCAAGAPRRGRGRCGGGRGGGSAELVEAGCDCNRLYVTLVAAGHRSDDLGGANPVVGCALLYVAGGVGRLEFACGRYQPAVMALLANLHRIACHPALRGWH